MDHFYGDEPENGASPQRRGTDRGSWLLAGLVLLILIGFAIVGVWQLLLSLTGQGFPLPT